MNEDEKSDERFEHKRPPTFFEAVWDTCPSTGRLASWKECGLRPAVDSRFSDQLRQDRDVGYCTVCVALDAFEAPEARKQPRRIVLVVDRRVVGKGLNVLHRVKSDVRFTVADDLLRRLGPSDHDALMEIASRRWKEQFWRRSAA